MLPSTVYCDTCGAANQPQAWFCIACGKAMPAAFSLPPTVRAGPVVSSTPPTMLGGPALSSLSPTGLLASHSLLKGRYRILKRLGQGGMGAVYKAADTQLGNRFVAVKEMSQKGLDPQEIAEAAEAFKGEAHMLAGLFHRHLPRIYDHFSDAGRWYLVMDFIEGETLEEHLAKAGGKLPVKEVLDIGIQLCTVLSYLHSHQPKPIIFRDLKPANVMRTPDGDLFLIDFGIARFFKHGQAKDTVAYGSQGYAAPEQYGKAQTTPRSDIYSLGATLHHLLSGSDPSQSPFVFAPLSGATIPAELATLIARMVKTEANQRPASMADVKKDLQRLAAQPTGSPVSLPPTQRAVNLPLPPTQLARASPLHSTYAGQAYNTTLNTTVNITLTFAQNQDKISGFCSVELLFGGSGPFTGTIDTAGRVKFTIQANDGSGTITAAIGTIQPDGSLRGSYMAENPAAQGVWFARPVRTLLP